MLFTEFRFFVFFAIVFGIYWLLPTNQQRKVLLLIGSYIFYAAWNWRFLILIIASTIIDFLIGLKLGSLDPKTKSTSVNEKVIDYAASDLENNRRHRLLWISLSVCWNLGVLFFFKYFNFGIDSAQHLLTWLGLHPSLHTLNIILPVGISFFTFQSMSYSIDIYRGTLEPCESLLDFSTFIGFFPQLFSGPIVRAIDFLPQLKDSRRLEHVRGRAMVMMFIIGYIKKACVADNLAPFVDEYFKNPGQYNWLGCWTAVLFYSAQIYCDFSGYTDMAIASAGLLGFEFCQNFDFPYFSPNIAEFWRRWHMSLSSWLRDYLYIPLGGNRGSKLFQHRNLFLTMLLGGLWHGAAWTFVVWGALHGLGLIVHREFRNAMKGNSLLASWKSGVGRWTVNPNASNLKSQSSNAEIERPTSNVQHTTSNVQRPTSNAAAFLGVLLTFLWVSLTWIFFRAPGFGVAMQTVRSFVLFRSPGTADFGINCLIAFAGLAIIHWIAHRRWLHAWWERVPAWQFAAICGVILATALPWTPLRYQPFIYFQF
jgi:alginate O-acetyltransferase complex protein AlgI